MATSGRSFQQGDLDLLRANGMRMELSRMDFVARRSMAAWTMMEDGLVTACMGLQPTRYGLTLWCLTSSKVSPLAFCRFGRFLLRHVAALGVEGIVAHCSPGYSRTEKLLSWLGFRRDGYIVSADRSEQFYRFGRS